MGPPLKGADRAKGTSKDALIILNSDEEFGYSTHSRQAADDDNSMDLVDSPTVQQLEGRSHMITDRTSTQKSITNKYFNLKSDKYYSKSFYVYIEKTNEQNIGRLHPMHVGHILHKLLKINNIISVKSIGRNRIKVELKFAIDANMLVNNTNLESHNLKAFIPNHLLEKKGLIRGVDTQFDLEYLKENIESPTKIINLYRLNKKVERDNKIELVPKQSVIITFEGNVLPASVYINSVVCTVEPYLGRVTQCFRCLKYGHVAKQCRGTTTLCIACGNVKTENHVCDKEIFCIYCKNTNHNSISKNCPAYEKQKRIKTVMLENNLSFNEAKEFSEKSFSNCVSVNNKFELLGNLNYDKDFPNLPNIQNPTNFFQTHNLSNRFSYSNNKVKSFSQPSSSKTHFTVNNNGNKKRKIYSSPSNSPPVTPMFPFRFGSPSKNTEILNPIPSLPPHIMESVTNFILKLLNNITSLEEIKKINNGIIIKELNTALEDTLSKT